jgi:imidazole glycerol-phosphate synthase subunit HisF
MHKPLLMRFCHGAEKMDLCQPMLEYLRPPPRIIARLDIKGPNVIKGIHLEGLRIVGKPGEMARRYYEQSVDEIIYMDTVASLYGRNNILPVIEEAARDIFVPLTVGGGIRNIDDIVAALRAGADKVAINTAAVARPDFIRQAAEVLGSQCIVLSVEAKRRGPDQWEVLTDNGRERTGLDVLEWVQRAAGLGAGEILITSVDMEGTQKGFDLPLVRAVRERVSIPVIASGGAGTAKHVLDLAREGVADAIACASIFHYGSTPVPALRHELSAGGIPVRV